jgi:altronate dehydratase large subunit
VTLELAGFPRSSGQWGFRNHVLVLPLHAAACRAAIAVSERIDGVIAVSHDWTGRGSERDVARTERIFAGFARHPNVFATVLIGLDGGQVRHFERVMADRLVTMSLADCGGTTAVVERAIDVAVPLVDASGRELRERAPLAELVLGLECGGSDALSGITANPALGVASDLLVEAGGTSILAETSELLGAEHLLAARAVSPTVARELVEMVSRFERDVAALGIDLLGGQPVPGNIAGGLTTIEEKSLGAAKKGGSAPIQGVLDFAEPPEGRGLFVMDTPGNDIEQMVGMVAAECQLVAFTTGRGTPTGSPIAPCLKIASNSSLYGRLGDDLDVNAGTIIDGTRTLEDVGREILAALVEVANGRLTAAERHRERQFALSRLDPVTPDANSVPLRLA